MRQIEELKFLDALYYFKEHTWAKVEGDFVRVGITDYAQDQLGEVIFIELPRVGVELAMGDEFGKAESAKIVSSLYMPISGKVTAINYELEASPEIVNSDPYQAGWMLLVQPADIIELRNLLTKDKYIAMLEKNE
jgi:glycine cleavage system H protein